MKDLSWYYEEADKFKRQRAELGAALGAIDQRKAAEIQRLNERYQKQNASIDAFYRNRRDGLYADYERDADKYDEQRKKLNSYYETAKQWCGKSLAGNYIPHAERVNDYELQKLIEMIEERGVVAWFKRCFQIGGYKPRHELASDLYERICDCIAYCEAQTAAAKASLSKSLQDIQTEERRRKEGMREQEKTERAEQQEYYVRERDKARGKLQACVCSPELLAFNYEIDKEIELAETTYGPWGEYEPSLTYPPELLVGNVELDVLNENGIEEKKQLPLWMPLGRANMVVLTSSRQDVAENETDSDTRKQIVRQMLARMLKTVPAPECQVSVFDTLHKGGSLERLVGVSNVGTNDLGVDVFSESEECTLRCEFLCKKVEAIHRQLEGKYTLYDLRAKSNDVETPFNWLVDFNFPNEPDRRYVEQLRTLFTNASTCGFSFVFVTTTDAAKQLFELAEETGLSSVIHIDCDRRMCTMGAYSWPYTMGKSPDNQQLDNFMAAITRFYGDSERIDNRITSVFMQNKPELLDASTSIKIPVALNSRGKVMSIELGSSGNIHGFISGDTGSGKSTLLHTIITSACMHYHPDDLEIWLADYKQTEFAIYKEPTPPHIKLIGLSKTKDFTYSLLDKIHEEFSHRSELFMRFGVQNLASYRKHKGENGYENLPRVLLIIDEFHEMSQFVEGEQSYKDKLENMLREYRAQGLNCLFADQTFSSGLRGLTQSAKNQVGLRIAMRNKVAPDEVQTTLEANAALFSESVKQTISRMDKGDFIMRNFVRDKSGNITDVTLEKFKALLTEERDVRQISAMLRDLYKGFYQPKQLMYISTKEQVKWDEADREAIDALEPLRERSMRFYLGRAATLRPCFAIDMSRQPNENVAIVGGQPEQRWQVVAAAMNSCRYRSDCQTIVFLAEDSDLEVVCGQSIRAMCTSLPNVTLCVGVEQWCGKLSELETYVDQKRQVGDALCVFIGLELMNMEMPRLPSRAGEERSISFRVPSFSFDQSGTAKPEENTDLTEFNALPIIDKLFSFGSRYGMRCLTEVSVYRQYERILKIKEMCKHKVAFNMSADDCLMYMGNIGFSSQIGSFAIYNDGGRSAQQLVPYLF